jgi:hypothetical protein
MLVTCTNLWVKFLAHKKILFFIDHEFYFGRKAVFRL